MKCPKCKKETVKNAKFCSHCGASTGVKNQGIDWNNPMVWIAGVVVVAAFFIFIKPETDKSNCESVAKNRFKARCETSCQKWDIASKSYYTDQNCIADCADKESKGYRYDDDISACMKNNGYKNWGD